MSHINVLVVWTSADLKAEVLAKCVAARPDMTLVGARFVVADKAETFLDSLALPEHCAVALVGDPADPTLAERWLARRADLVIMLVNVAGDFVRLALRDPRLNSLLNALRDLAEGSGTQGRERVVSFQLPPASAVELSTSASQPSATSLPLLDASIGWLHQLLRDAVDRAPGDNGDVNGLSVTRATLLQALDGPAKPSAEGRPANLAAAEAALTSAFDDALASRGPLTEPLATAARALKLNRLEFQMLLLGLAPEIDFRFQRCIGFLLDELGRRVGSFGLYSMLLGAGADVRGQLAVTGALDRWLVFDTSDGRRGNADEPLRIDPPFGRWLLGEGDALAHDPRVRRAIRLEPWLGATLLTRPQELIKMEKLFSHEDTATSVQWLVLNREDPSGWRALIERGAAELELVPIRIEVARLSGLDLIEIEETARRLGRFSRMTGRPLIVDLVKAQATEGDDEWLRIFLATMSDVRCRVVAITADEAQLVALIGKAPFLLIDEDSLPVEAQLEAVRTAAAKVEVFLTDEGARAIAARFPLRIDRLEQAMNLALARRIDFTAEEPRLQRFTTACKELVAEGLSRLADRLEPVFDLEDVVLPTDRKRQLIEIVDNVRLAHQVLDEWKFGERLPYGRGVTALFFGPSGTGKTMAAMGIARRLNIQILRLDLSRVVSKYIGETEKNIDRVFSDAQRSGAAILIDEADALLGKRSEVKDAHDRYANIEVAFLLQRMEAYRGLAILTTNMRQTLDPAFLRRLRFIVDFPRPDAEARQVIWRQCLPEGSHTLTDAAFRQLGRKVDVTGGHIRQITLRAAFIAAAAGVRLALEHVAQATCAELAKLGMPAVEIDLTAARRAA